MNLKRFGVSSLHFFCCLFLTFTLACSETTSTTPSGSSDFHSQPKSTSPSTITISAAASTRELLEALAKEFRQESHIEIKINAGPSSGLANQIIAGAPVDLFLSASSNWADEVEKAGLCLERVNLLTNRLALVVPKSNPAGVETPRDLLKESVQKIALAGEQVPAGMYAGQALERIGILDQLSRETKIVRGQDVRSALSFVERGEADAGLVYSTDLNAADGVRIVYEFDPKLHDPIVYVLMRLNSNHPNEADEFYRFLNSERGNSVIARFRFARP